VQPNNPSLHQGHGQPVQRSSTMTCKWNHWVPSWHVVAGNRWCAVGSVSLVFWSEAREKEVHFAPGEAQRARSRGVGGPVALNVGAVNVIPATTFFSLPVTILWFCQKTLLCDRRSDCSPIVLLAGDDQESPFHSSWNWSRNCSMNACLEEGRGVSCEHGKSQGDGR
jgi:hypothetical protein